MRVRQFIERSDAGTYCRAKVDQRTGVCAVVDSVSKRILNWTQQKLTQVNSSEKGVSKIKLGSSQDLREGYGTRSEGRLPGTVTPRTWHS